MQICASYHEEITFEEWDCPMCALIREHDAEIIDIENKVNEIQQQSDEYKYLLETHNPELLL